MTHIPSDETLSFCEPAFGLPILRTACKGDLDVLCRFYQMVIEDLEKRTNYPLWTWGIHPSRQMLEDAISNQEIVLVQDGDHLCAAAMLSSALEGEELVSWSGLHPMAIHLFAIDPTLGGRKISDWFLNALIKQIEAAGFDSIRLNLIAGNRPARNLYVRAGFESRGEVDIDLPKEGILHFEMMERSI